MPFFHIFAAGMEILVDDIRVEVVRRSVRSMRLTVYPDSRVRLVVPWLTPDIVARGFVERKKEWLIKHYCKMQLRQLRQEPQYVTGEPFVLMGRALVLRVEYVGTGGQGVVLRGDEMILYCHSSADREKRKALVEAFCRSELYKYIRGRLDECCGQYGEASVEFSIRRMKTEWGSCTARRRKMLFNLKLAVVPKDLIDYVVVHELCHLQVQNHSRQFWELVESRMPDYRERRQRLKEY